MWQKHIFHPWRTVFMLKKQMNFRNNTLNLKCCKEKNNFWKKKLQHSIVAFFWNHHLLISFCQMSFFRVFHFFWVHLKFLRLKQNMCGLVQSIWMKFLAQKKEFCLFLPKIKIMMKTTLQKTILLLSSPNHFFGHTSINRNILLEFHFHELIWKTKKFLLNSETDQLKHWIICSYPPMICCVVPEINGIAPKIPRIWFLMIVLDNSMKNFEH